MGRAIALCILDSFWIRRNWITRDVASRSSPAYQYFGDAGGPKKPSSVATGGLEHLALDVQPLPVAEKDHAMIADADGCFRAGGQRATQPANSAFADDRTSNLQA